MNLTKKVTGIVIFGVVLSMLLPQLITNVTSKSLKSEVQTSKTSSQTNKSEIAMNTKKDSAVPTETKEENPVEEVKEEIVEPEQPAPEPVEEQTPIVYDNMTMQELADKLNRSLNSTLSGTGMTFANLAVSLGIDPYLSLAIVLEETGCSYNCSAAVNNKNNVGGMMGSGGLLSFESLDAGITAFMNNLKKNYYDQGLTTAEAMNSKYAASTTWSGKINNYIEKIKSA